MLRAGWICCTPILIQGGGKRKRARPAAAPSESPGRNGPRESGMIRDVSGKPGDPRGRRRHRPSMRHCTRGPAVGLPSPRPSLPRPSGRLPLLPDPAVSPPPPAIPPGIPKPIPPLRRASADPAPPFSLRPLMPGNELFFTGRRFFSGRPASFPSPFRPKAALSGPFRVFSPRVPEWRRSLREAIIRLKNNHPIRRRPGPPDERHGDCGPLGRCNAKTAQTTE
jgi:hypothetical protein